jgi:hypothetical protein
MAEGIQAGLFSCPLSRILAFARIQKNGFDPRPLEFKFSKIPPEPFASDNLPHQIIVVHAKMTAKVDLRIRETER